MNHSGANILVVEDNAHHPSGHFPNRFAELADGFHDAGCDVHVLTSRGWVFEGEVERSWSVRRYSRLSTCFIKLIEQIQRLNWLVLRPIQKTTAVILQVVSIWEVRRVANRMPQPCVIVSLSSSQIPQFVELFGGSYKWIVHVFRLRKPYPFLKWLAGLLPKKSEVIVAVPNAQWCLSLDRCFEENSCMLLPLAGVRSAVSGAGCEEKAFSDPKSSLKTALLFGSGHSEQDTETVIEAFREIGGWQLVIAGGCVERVQDKSLDSFLVEPKTIGGFLSESQRHDCFLNCDCVILSFVSPYDRNSGTLMDALSYRKPAVVSSGSSAAEITSEFGNGMVFEAGDGASLATVLREFNPEDHTLGVRTAADFFSNKAIAERHLDAAFADDPSQKTETQDGQSFQVY